MPSRMNVLVILRHSGAASRSGSARLNGGTLVRRRCTPSAPHPGSGASGMRCAWSDSEESAQNRCAGSWPLGSGSGARPSPRLPLPCCPRADAPALVQGSTSVLGGTKTCHGVCEGKQELL